MFEYDMKSTREQNRTLIRSFFADFLKEIKYDGYFGIASFSNVYDELMPVQQNKVNEILGKKIDDFMETGSIISLSLCYKSEIIDCINVKKEDGSIDKERWNIYAGEYEKINSLLTQIGKKISEKFGGYLIMPVTGAPIEVIKKASDYFPHTISHRLIAEHAGVGWRGKSELLVTEKNGSALRFASILINIPLIQNNIMENKCGNCIDCLESCFILKTKSESDDYREKCRKFLDNLGLKNDVCGKCVKSCYNRFNKESSNDEKKIGKILNY
jgi:epoxyqueuosine reductase QueG